MALIKCPDCGKEFSEYADHCPACGYLVDDVKENGQVEQKQVVKKEIPVNVNTVSKKHIIFIICGLVLLCGIGSYFLCCAEGGLITDEKDAELEKLALATGWITTEMPKDQSQERLADTAFVSYLKRKIEKVIIRQIVLDNPVGILSSKTENAFAGMCEANERHCAILVVQNKTDKEFPEGFYSISFFPIEYFRECIENKNYYSTDKIQTIPGKLIPPNGKATFEIEEHNKLGGSSHMGMSYVAKIDFDIDNLVLSDLYEPTGQEYNEYLISKKEPIVRNTNSDASFVYEGYWKSSTYGNQPCRIAFSRDGQHICNAKYTNLKCNATISLNGDIDDGVLSFFGSIQNHPLNILMFNDENHLIGIGQDECHEDYNVEIEQYRIIK